MYAKTLKKQLNAEMVVKVLESIGSEKIKERHNCITATRPSGNNPNGIVIYTENFNAEMFTDSGFSEEYKTRDIISLVQYIRGISFGNAIKYICKICSIDYYQDDNEDEAVPEFMKWLLSVENTDFREKESIKPIPKEILNQFINHPHIKWTSENINPDVMKKHNIGYDVESDSITIPIYDSTGELVGVKCRATDDKAEQKYWYMYPCPKSKIVYGLDKNYYSIKESGRVFIFEAEKSVLKAESFGIKNSVAIGGKILSDKQCEEILRLNSDIVLALDNDVEKYEMDNIISQLIFPVKTNRIYTLSDESGVYQKYKDSPADSSEILCNIPKYIKEAKC